MFLVYVTILLMERAQKSPKSEPTISDVMGAIQDLTEAVQIGFAKNDAQHDEMKESIGEVGYRVTALEKRTGTVEKTVEDVRVTLDGVARAIDKDAVTSIDHEVRITHLEKICVV